jgi:hypothetical protein
VEPVTFLEVLDRRGRVRQRIAVAEGAIVVGRAYDNDVVVDDPYVSERHVRIDTDPEGAVVAHDLGSRNGLFVVGHGRAARAERADLGAGEVARIGESLLRVRRTTDPVPPARPLVPGPWPLEWLERPRVAGLMLLVIPLDFAFERTFQTYTDWTFAAALSWELILSAAVILSWAGVWALVTRITRHEWRLPTHAAIFLAASAVMRVLLTATNYGHFLTDAPAIDWTITVAWVLLIAWMLRMHIAVATTLEPGPRVAVAFAIATVVAGVMPLTHYWGEQGFSTALDYARQLRPVPVAWLPAETAEAFFDDAEGLREAADEARAEADEEAEGHQDDAAAETAHAQVSSVPAASRRRSFQ